MLFVWALLDAVFVDRAIALALSVLPGSQQQERSGVPFPMLLHGKI